MICHFLIGMPAAGKSTFAQCLSKLIQDTIISSDTIRRDLYGDEIIQGNWIEIEREIIKRLKVAISQGKSVIYDATNAKRVWRMEMLQKFSSVTGEQINWLAWYLKLPLEICKQRNLNRNRQVPDTILESMNQSLRDFPPLPAEGFMRVEIIEDEVFKLVNVSTDYPCGGFIHAKKSGST
jgi:predicted kinase